MTNPFDRMDSADVLEWCAVLALVAILAAAIYGCVASLDHARSTAYGHCVRAHSPDECRGVRP